MSAHGVAHALFDGTAYLLALVLLTRLHLPADLLAPVALYILDLFLRQQLQLQVIRVVHLVARQHASVFPAEAHLLNQGLTPQTVFIVALLRALVSLAGQELFADTCLADRDLVRALSSLLAKEGYDLFPAAGAELNSRWHLLARLALTVVAHLLAFVFPTV